MVFKFFGKKSRESGIKNKIEENLMKLMKLINQLLGNLKKEKCILFLKTILVVLI